jgi:hypothetical protein
MYVLCYTYALCLVDNLVGFPIDVGLSGTLTSSENITVLGY